MNTGKITKYFKDEGYGLIVDKNESEHFFYTKDIEADCPFEIKEGVTIEFDPSRWNHFHAVHLCDDHKARVKKLKGE